MTQARSLTQFTVSGNSRFPMDMLRYDKCWPADTTSALGILRTAAEDEYETFTFVMHTWSVGITPDRWRSFGWTVTDQVRV